MAEEGKGRLLERWQYRQEMIAPNVWSRWGGLPTRDEFERFHDARELLATMEMWCPAEVPVRSLQEVMKHIDALSPENQQYIQAMTWKRIEEGITGQEYSNLVNVYRMMDRSVAYTPAQQAYSRMVDRHMRAQGIEPYHTHAYQRVRQARERERAWDALSTEEQQARVREAYESRGSDPRVEAAQEQLFAQQREEGEWVGWHEPRSAADVENWESEAREVEYPTQYAGMMGSAPERLEIDTSDTEMGQRWQDQLAALEARLGAVVQEQAAYQQSHEQGMRY
jgi:hypothetical protein